MKRLCCVLLLLGASVPVEAADSANKPAANPAATKLLADARAARASWEHFPGFTANLEINIDGQVMHGKVAVSPKGKVELSGFEEREENEAVTWARRTLASTVGHRLDNSAELDTPCAFLDDNTRDPLGRAIRVLNDEFHSSYRIRDRQVIVVNRQMRDARFTITVMENKQNAEKKYLPVCFVVNTWDKQTGALKQSQTHHQTWRRLGKFDLPERTLVVTATAGKLGARSLKLTQLRLEGEGKR
jgi:hypothetical protein